MDIYDVFELFRRAQEALDSPNPCRITAKAYWLNGKQAVKDMIRNAPADEQEALEGVQKHVELEVKELSLDDDIDYQAAFWEGYLDGIERNTMPEHHTRAYEEGYFAARLGR